MTELISASPLPMAASVFRGDSEMAARMRDVDWAATPLGPVDRWSASLRTIVATLLSSRHAMFLWWGPDLIQFYNDAYRQSLGPDRHPSAVGQRGRDCWAEIWPIIGPEVDSVMAGGPATWHEDFLVPITRGDAVHDVYWSYSYSPVQDEDGSVGGVLVTVQETTRRVESERRARAMQELAASLQHAATVEEVCGAAVQALEAAPHDVAFALLYLSAPGGAGHRLVGSVGMDPGRPSAPRAITEGDESAWPMGRALAVQGNGPMLSAPPELVRRELWPEPVAQAVTLALETAARQQKPYGALVLGLNPRVPFDRAYSDFARQAAREIAVALDRVRRLAAERQVALDAARAEQRLLEEIFKLSPSFLAVLRGPDHVFELANPAYFQVVGHRPMLGRPLREALPEVAGQGFVELLDGVYRTGEPYVGSEVSIALQLAPGAALVERHVNFVYQPMRDASGAVTGILASGVDVSALVAARKAAELARLEAEQVAGEHDVQRRQLLTVLEQSPLGIVIAEAPSGRYLFRNPRVRELLGEEDAPEAIGDAVGHWEGFHPDGREVGPDEWPMPRALRGESVWNEVLELRRRATGRRIEISVNAAPVRDADGRIIAGVAMFWDVTQERRAERELRDVQRIQAVGTLAGGVAHEINNQMTAVVGFGEFVLRALGPDHPQASDVRLVLQAGQRAARVSQQLLAFTRQQVMQPRLLDLPDVVAELEPVLRHLLGSDKGLHITSARGVRQVSADLEQVQQVLINLVANARDATESGTEIRIGIENVTLDAGLPAPLGETVVPGRYVRLSVRDTGTGMTPETLARSFDPFFTTKAVGKGTGMGLPMVYGTMRRHGGYVVAHSTPGGGTTMELYWPVSAGADTLARAGGERDSGGTRVAEASGTVVVAEDDSMVRALAVRSLQEEGYRVLAASNGAEAVALLERDASVRILVTDVIMPRMNGRELSDVVRACWPKVGVLFMSGHTGEGEVLERLVPPGAPFLQKPFTPDELARAVGAIKFSAAHKGP